MRREFVLDAIAKLDGDEETLSSQAARLLRFTLQHDEVMAVKIAEQLGFRPTKLGDVDVRTVYTFKADRR